MLQPHNFHIRVHLLLFVSERDLRRVYFQKRLRKLIGEKEWYFYFSIFFFIRTSPPCLEERCNLAWRVRSMVLQNFFNHKHTGGAIYIIIRVQAQTGTSATFSFSLRARTWCGTSDVVQTNTKSYYRQIHVQDCRGHISVTWRGRHVIRKFEILSNRQSLLKLDNERVTSTKYKDSIHCLMKIMRSANSVSCICNLSAFSF